MSMVPCGAREQLVQGLLATSCLQTSEGREACILVPIARWGSQMMCMGDAAAGAWAALEREPSPLWDTLQLKECFPVHCVFNPGK